MNKFFTIFFLLVHLSFAFCERPIPEKPPEWDKWSFSQKVRWRGHNPDPRINYGLYADKLRVKDYVQNDFNVAKVLFVPKEAKSISLEQLPKSFIMKANNSCNRGIMVVDGLVLSTKKRAHEFDPFPVTEELLRSYFTQWKTRPAYRPKYEKQYKLIKPQIFFEEYVEDIMLELHFHCFYGEVKVVCFSVQEEGETDPRCAFYDRDWNQLSVTRSRIKPALQKVSKPLHLDAMIATIEKLTKGIDYVRVDLFMQGETPYFGEFTFTPDGGHVKYEPESYNIQMGSYWPYPAKGNPHVTKSIH